jgi:hypothetical protein
LVKESRKEGYTGASPRLGSGLILELRPRAGDVVLSLTREKTVWLGDLSR